MTQAVEKIEYAYDELDDKAKAKAMEWHVICVYETFGDGDDLEVYQYHAKEAGKRFGAYVHDVQLGTERSSLEGRIDVVPFITYLIDNDQLDAAQVPQYVILRELAEDGWLDSCVRFDKGGRSGTRLDDINTSLDNLSEGDKDVLERGMLKGAQVYDLAESIMWESLIDDMHERMAKELKEIDESLCKQVRGELDWLSSEECFKESEYVNGWRFDRDGNIV
jgi:hypothetical protein